MAAVVVLAAKQGQSDVALDINNPIPDSPLWSTSSTVMYYTIRKGSTLLSSATTEGL